MQRLILVRHAKPKIDPGVPPSMWHLSEEGRTQCERLADHLASVHGASVFASPEPKATETATVLAGRLKCPISVVDGLQEHNRDNADMMSPEDFVESVRQVLQNPDRPVFGFETGLQAQQRFCAAVDGILCQHPHVNPIIVAHGTVISLYLSRNAGLDPFAVWQRLGLPSLVELTAPVIQLVRIQERLE